MPNYKPPMADIRFLLTQVFDFDREMQALGYDEVNADLALAILSEGGRFCAEVLEPLNARGDIDGARLENGAVVTSPGLAEAYRRFRTDGWAALSGDPAYGGQGLPRTVQVLFDEMVSSANLSFALFPGLTRGAAEAIGHHADDALKSVYLRKMIAGEWTGAMALTEAGAGTDLGLLTAKAVPADHGSYKLTGTKIFISSGDHDFGGNVVHLVLARLPDAPPGVKGISLFLVPKFFAGVDDCLGPRNRMSVGSLEHKMGIHAQPTCVIHYEGATGWLVGDPHRGLNAMFTMMNAERLFVGIQGLGIAEAAYQRARDYAKERLQGRAPDGGIGPCPIVAHADVRRMLMTIRTLTEGGRALALWTALEMDKAAKRADSIERAAAGGLVALMTPVIKAALTDFGFEAAVTAQQVFGGHGYIRDTGIEQFVRDARITQIYEGTNGVQALDLVARKLPMDGGVVVERLFELIAKDLDAIEAQSGLAELVTPVSGTLAKLQEITARLVATSDPAIQGAAATDYLRLFALVSLGWMWCRMAAADSAAGGDAGKRNSALFFVTRLLPQTHALAAAIAAGPAGMMTPDASWF